MTKRRQTSPKNCGEPKLQQNAHKRTCKKADGDSTVQHQATQQTSQRIVVNTQKNMELATQNQQTGPISGGVPGMLCFNHLPLSRRTDLFSTDQLHAMYTEEQGNWEHQMFASEQKTESKMPRERCARLLGKTTAKVAPKGICKKKKPGSMVKRMQELGLIKDVSQAFETDAHIQSCYERGVDPANEMTLRQKQELAQAIQNFDISTSIKQENACQALEESDMYDIQPSMNNFVQPHTVRAPLKKRVAVKPKVNSAATLHTFVCGCGESFGSVRSLQRHKQLVCVDIHRNRGRPQLEPEERVKQPKKYENPGRPLVKEEVPFVYKANKPPRLFTVYEHDPLRKFFAEDIKNVVREQEERVSLHSADDWDSDQDIIDRAKLLLDEDLFDTVQHYVNSKKNTKSYFVNIEPTLASMLQANESDAHADDEASAEVKVTPAFASGWFEKLTLEQREYTHGITSHEVSAVKRVCVFSACGSNPASQDDAMQGNSYDEAISQDMWHAGLNFGPADFGKY